MNRSLRSVAAPGAALLALGLTLSACGDANTTAVNGAGSSAQDAAMKAWRSGYQNTNSKATINYSPTGSGAGVTSFNQGDIDFAGSDSALSTDPATPEVDAAKTRCGGANAFEVPSYVSTVDVVFQLDGVSSLNLTASTIAKIFNGKITKWNDNAIKADNAGVTLPDADIHVVHRNDDSGTTKNFTDYLHTVAPTDWTYPADKKWPNNVGEGIKGSSGVAGLVTTGSIGYVDASDKGSLGIAKIKVGSEWVAPSADGAAKAFAAAAQDTARTPDDLVYKIDRTTTAAGAYPLILASYVIACPTYDSAKADIVKGFLSYVVSTDGQAAAAAAAGSAPLPASVQSQAAAIIAKIAAK